MPMRIGDFAGRTGATVKALRHYDEIGLLRPATVDAGTGYRLYAPEQEKLVAWIQVLQSLRFTLAEIRQLLNGPTDADALLRRLKHKRVELAQELELWLTRRVQIDRLIRIVEQEGFEMNGALEIGRTIDLMAIGADEVHEIKKHMPNQEMFLDNARDTLAENGGGSVGVLIMDIRHFKGVNDRYGHEVGDKVIVAIYDLLAAAMKASGLPHTIGRTGGDEFAAFFIGAEADARKLAEGFAKSVEDADFGPVGVEQKMGVTVGCVVAGNTGAQSYATIRTLVEKAHEAVFDAWRVSNDGKTPSGICVRALDN